MINIEMLQKMPNLDLEDRIKNITKRILDRQFSDTTDEEIEMCYLHREMEFRMRRMKAHDEYLEKMRKKKFSIHEE